MQIACPNCEKVFEIDLDARAVQPISVERRCPGCRARIGISLGVELREKAVPAGPACVLVAVDGEATRELIREVLSGAGYEILEAADGQQAISLLEVHHPPVALLDVGLPQVFGFQVCEAIKTREDLRSIRVILVAAIHNQGRYRRNPSNLYGADDYIERHQILSGLIPKIQRLLGSSTGDSPEAPDSSVAVQEPPHGARPERFSEAEPAAEKEQTQPEPEVGEEVCEVESVQPAGTGPVAPEETAAVAQQIDQVVESPAHQAARRLARIIISDIALYNPERLRDAVANGEFYQVFRDEIEEGRKLYNERVPEEVRTRHDYFSEAIEDYIKRQRGG